MDSIKLPPITQIPMCAREVENAGMRNTSIKINLIETIKYFSLTLSIFLKNTQIN